MEQKTRGFIPYLPFFIPEAKNCEELAKEILHKAEMPLPEVRVRADGDGEKYKIEKTPGGYTVSGGNTGVLYGVHALLRALYVKQPVCEGEKTPCYPLRMLNHWDNMTGDVERGYAGKSLFFRDDRIVWNEDVMHRYGMMLSSIGINSVCLNNVNVHFPADRLITEDFLPEMKKIADILRIYGVKLLISIDFSMPTRNGLDTADPLDEDVIRWWEKQTALVYSYIPDLTGYLVKADSEHRAGPYTYGRNHAEGANMLAGALKPFGGKLVWRCFVYDCGQDWRNHSIDRPKAAYDNYAYLDGQFEDNVILQIKNGPYDFQVREGVSPLLFAMPQTKKALEVQLAQEYTGQQIDLFFMPPQWQDIRNVLPAEKVQAICAVTNLGDSINWAGHDLALLNLYAFGGFAMTGEPRAEETAETGAKLLFSDDVAANTVKDMLLVSCRVYEDYASPFGLGWMVTPGRHYGVNCEGYEYDVWGTYHRANFEAVGIERGPEGTDMTSQYPEPLKTLYARIDTCPEELLLFFHRVRYDHVMKDGRTLLQRIYDNHFRGYEGAKKLQSMWLSLEGKMDDALFCRVKEKFELQVKNAREWCDEVNTYFYRFTGIPDEQGRKIWD